MEASDCPCCNSPMIVHNDAEVLFLCEFCYGAMASKDWLENNLKPGILKRLQLSLSSGQKANFSCPLCKGDMSNTQALVHSGPSEGINIQIDGCNRCDGIWFDNKELEAFIPESTESFDVTIKTSKNIFSQILDTNFWSNLLK